MSNDNPAQSTPDEPATEAEAVPMNRAERRAKGKKSAQQGQPGNGPQFAPKGGSQGHGPRLWANRRAG